MPNWKKVVVSGSNADLNQVTASRLLVGDASNQYSFPSQTGSQDHALIVDSNGNLTFGDVSGSLPDGVISSSTQIVNYDEFARIRGGNTISGSQTFLGDNIQFGPDPNSPDSALTTQIIVTGSFITTGFIAGEGGLIIGDNTPDDINTPDTVDFQARVTSSFIPSDDNVFDLGSGSLRWGTVHADNWRGTGTIEIDSPNDARIVLDRNANSSDSEIVFQTAGTENWSIGTGQIGGDNDFTLRAQGSANVFRLTQAGHLQNLTSASIDYITASVFVGDGSQLTGITADSSSYVEWDNVVQKPVLYSGSSQLVDALDGQNLSLGVVSASILHEIYTTQSINLGSGSFQFGDTIDDTHTFTGSVNITGSLNVIGNIDSVGRIDTDDSMRSVFVGRDAGCQESSGFRYNTGIGYVALANMTTGVCNTSIGFQSLGFLSTGDNNVGLGIWAGLGVQTGDNNTYVGSEAGYSFSAGANRAENTVVGYRAQYNGGAGDCNTIMGACSGYSLTSGGLNTILGWRAAAGLTTGGSNVFIGGNAGYSATTGNNNVVLGYNSSLMGNTDSNSIVIGNNATGSGSNTIMIGSSTHTDTRIYGQVEIDGISDVSESIAALEHFSESRAWSSGSFSGSFFGDGSGLTGITADGTISSSAQIASEISGAFNSASSSIAGDIEDILDGTSTVPSASHTVSSSFSTFAESALSAESATSSSYIQWSLVVEKPDGIVSSSAQLPADLVSSSTQITALGFISESFSTAGTGILSGSSQIASEISGAFTSTSSSLAATIEDIVDGTTTVPSASLAATASYISSSNIVGFVQASSVDWDDVNDKPEDLVSSSAQITSLGFISESFSTAGTGITSGSAQIVDLLDGQNLNLGVVSASILHEIYTTQSINLGSGSFQFGDTTDDTHTFTGSIRAHNGVTGSLLGTAATASIATTASYAVNADSALTASHAENALTASHALTSVTASYVETSQTASYIDATNINGVISASHVDWSDIENIPSDIVSSSTQITALGFISESFSTNGTGILSSSAQIASEISGAFTADSASFSASIASLETFSASRDFSSGSFSGSFQGDGSGLTGITADGTLSSSAQIASEISGAFTADSASFSASIAELEVFSASLGDVVSSSTQITALGFISESFSTDGTDIVSSSTQITGLGFISESFSTAGTGILSSSAQIGTEISGAFTADSASFSASIASLETFSASLDATFATEAELNSATQSLSQSIATDISASDARLDVLDGLGLVSGSSTLVQINALSASGDIHFGGLIFGDGSNLTGITSSLIQNGLLFGLGLQGGTYNGELDITGSLDTSSVHFISGSEKAIEGLPNLALSGSLLGTATTASYVEWSNIDSVPAGIVSGSTQITSLGFVSESFSTDGTGILSSSAQISSEISGAFTADSASFSASIASLETFSASLDATFATEAELNTATQSLSQSIAADIEDILDGTSIVPNATSASYISSSNIVGNIEADSIAFINITGVPAGIVSSSTQTIANLPSGVVSGSAQITAHGFISESFSTAGTDIVSSSTQITGLGFISESFSTAGTGILSSSAQIASEISGAFTADSASFSSSIADLQTFSSSLDATFATEAELNSATQSLSQSIAADIEDILDGTLTVPNATSASYISSSNIVGDIMANEIAYTNITGVPAGIVSSSTQVVGHLPDGTLSSSAQVTAHGFISESFSTAGTGIHSSSAQVVSALNGQNVTLGEISATSINTSIVSSSITFTSGSNIFGDEASDVHEFTGSVEVQGGITGSLLGTASTGSHALIANTASHAEFADNAQTATTASYVAAANINGNVTSASYAATSSLATGLQMVSVDTTDQQFTVALVDTSSRSVVSYDTFDLTFNPSSGVLEVTGLTVENFTISESMIGNGTMQNAINAETASTADLATSADTASLATAIDLLNMPSMVDTYYPIFGNNNSGEAIPIATASVYFDRPSETLFVPNFSGSFTGNIENATTASFAHTASYVAANAVTNVTSYRETVSGATSYTVDHNLNERYPIVQCWNTSNNQMEIPASITSNTVNRVTVEFGLPFTGRIVVKI